MPVKILKPPVADVNHSSVGLPRLLVEADKFTVPVPHLPPGVVVGAIGLLTVIVIIFENAVVGPALQVTLKR